MLGLLDNILRGSSIHTIAHINVMFSGVRGTLQQQLKKVKYVIIGFTNCFKDTLDSAIITLAKRAQGDAEAMQINQNIQDLLEKEYKKFD